MSRIEDHMHLISFVLDKFFGGGKQLAKYHGMDPEDLEQIGAVGLVKADRDYKPNDFASFSTYAVTKIRFEIWRSLRDNNHCGRFPRSVKDIAGMIDRSLPLTVDSIMSQADVDYVMAVSVLDYITRTTISMNHVVGTDLATDDPVTMGDTLSSSDDVESIVIRRLEAKERWSMLSPRQRQIFHLVLSGKTQSDISKEVGLSQSRVSRHIARACKDLIHTN